MNTHHSSHPRRAVAGVTLVELLMVVVILGILVGIAGVPALDNAQQSLDLVEMELADAIKYAQSLALSTRAAHGVAFDTGNGRFAVVGPDGVAVEHPLTHKGFVTELRGPERPAEVSLTSAEFGSTNTAVVFDGQGVPLAGGLVSFTCQGTARTLSVDGATGWVGSL